MAILDSRLLGSIRYETEQVIRISGVMPGLDHVRSLLPLTQPTMEPFLFFQGIEDSGISLLAVPVPVVKNDFVLWLSEEDRDGLQLDDSESWTGPDVGAFALVTVNGCQVPTANLLAPLVVHFRKNLAVQAIQQLDESFVRFPIDVGVGRRSTC